MLDMINNLGIFYADQGKLVKAEQMYWQALQGYEKAIGLDKIFTYVLALYTIVNLGLFYEREIDRIKARAMFSKALRGYEQVFESDYTKSKTLRDKLSALDNILENEALVKTEEQAKDVLIGSASDINKPLSTSKRHKLLQRLGLRSRP